MTINNTQINTIQELEDFIVSFSDELKDYLRNEFNGCYLLLYHKPLLQKEMNKLAFCDYYCILELYKRLIYVLDLLTDTSFQVAMWDSFVLFIDDAKKAGFDLMLLIAGLSGALLKRPTKKKSFWERFRDVLVGGVTAMFVSSLLCQIMHFATATGIAYIIGRMGEEAPDLIIRLIRNKFKINPEKINTFFKGLFKK